MSSKICTLFMFLVMASLWLDAQGNNQVRSVFGRTGAVVAATGDYRFSQITGQISANQMPSNWWLLIPATTMCTQCPAITTPGNLQTGFGGNAQSIITLWDGVSAAPTIRAGVGPPVGLSPAGSQWIRTDTGTLYVMGVSSWVQK